MRKNIYPKERWVIITGSVLMGIIFPNLTGLISNANYTVATLVMHYLFFIATAYTIWRGNIFILNFVRKKIQWRNNQYYNIILLHIFFNIIFSGASSFLLLVLWKYFSNETYKNFEPVVYTSLIIIIFSIIITNLYEIIFLYGERESNTIKTEQLNVSKIKAELEALKNQIDPHFIFNALNTLSYLIVSNPYNAKLYTGTLANVYRYILSNKEKDFVLLKEEIEFLSNYFFLLKIRFSNSINLQVEINHLETQEFLIPPISLQILLENAIKHNDFSEQKPLTISVSVKANHVIVRNIMQPKSYPIRSTKTGLDNLNERYDHLMKKHITIYNNETHFIIKLPLLKLSNENSNY